LLEVVDEEVVMDFVLEVVSVASLVVGMIPLDAKALLHIDFPLGTLIDHVVLNPGSHSCFVAFCKTKRLKLVPDPSQLPAGTPLTSTH
jgi:hypothetical protein